ncbi:sulfite exporter TauE/SafE family protein [Shinella sumterensis]|uniref:sulfite exporter TauE/SafE family protein n=1 Tax=Shinella sumterensis TaxID=1967501 RepID=UPI003F87378C
METETIWLAAAFLLIATLYSSVGQAGASGYIAIMALYGFAPASMKITALALNLLVAGIASYHFLRNGRLAWRDVYPFAVLGFPFSLIGGTIQLPHSVYYPVVGVVLIASALQMARSALRRSSPVSREPTTPPFLPALATGAVIGFVSGTTGTGGGVFLAPVIFAMNWATARRTAAITAVYNLMNSAAALIGAHALWGALPAKMPIWLVAVAVGGVLGASLGSRYLSDRWLRWILALLLLFSGGKMLW